MEEVQFFQCISEISTYCTLCSIWYVVAHYYGTAFFMPRKRVTFSGPGHVANRLITSNKTILCTAQRADFLGLESFVYAVFAEFVSTFRKNFRVLVGPQANRALLLVSQ